MASERPYAIVVAPIHSPAKLLRGLLDALMLMSRGKTSGLFSQANAC